MAQDATIYNWSAKRSGTGITINGRLADGTPHKETVRRIELRASGPVGIVGSDDRHEIVLTLAARL